MAAAPTPALSPLFDRLAAPTAATWPDRREFWREQWRLRLGAFPAVKTPLHPEILGTEPGAGFVRQRVRYQIEPGVATEAYLLTPEHVSGRHAAVVVFHQTTRSGFRQPAGVDASVEELMQGVQLVQRGYVVLCPRCFIFEDEAWEAVGFARNTAAMRERHPDWVGLTRMTWDAIRAADFLTSLPGVDAGRIGCLGHSLGAREALYAAAFDERYRATVFNEGGIDLPTARWHPPWYLGEAALQPDYPLQHHQLLALIAPRPFLLLAGDSADTDASGGFVAAVKPVYELLGAPDNVAWFNHRHGHRYPPEARAVAETFLDLHLAPRRGA